MRNKQRTPARAVCFGSFLRSFFFTQQFVTQSTRKCAILHWVLSDNSSLVTEVELCEGLGNSDHYKVMFSISLENKPKYKNILVTNINQADFDIIGHKFAQIYCKAEFSGLDTLNQGCGVRVRVA